MADELFRKLEFSNDEREEVKKIIRGIYDSLLFRKISFLMPLTNEKREIKKMEFLKQDIDDYRLFMIYCFNNFTELQRAKTDSNDEMRFFSVPIEGILDDFYNKLIAKKNLLSEERIELLQKKFHRCYKSTELLYSSMMSKIERTCVKILSMTIIRDPVKLSIIMNFIFNTVNLAETDLMSSIVDDKKNDDDKSNKNPCDANKYLGIDWTFLGLFDELPEECSEIEDSTKISIVGPVKLQSKDISKTVVSGGSIHKSRKRKRHIKSKTRR